MSTVSQDVEVMHDNYIRAIELIKNFMDGKPVNKQVITAAQATIAAYTRLRGSEGNHNALVYQVARDFSNSKEELRKIISNSMPEMKGLPQGTTK